jgi:uncharacterized protein YbjT (DUF2867 family)
MIVSTSDGCVVRALLTGLLAASGTRKLSVAVIRSPNRLVPMAGVDWVLLDPTAPAACEHILARSTELMLLPSFDEQTIEAELALITQAKAAGVTTLHQISLAGADPRSAVRLLRWLGLVEREVRASGLRYSILRCAAMMQNLELFLRRVRSGPELVGPFRETPFAWIDARDVGEIAGGIAHTYRIDPSAGPIDCQLAGPEPLNFDAVARILGEALGEPVAYSDITMPEAQGVLVARGVAGNRIRNICQYWDYLVSGVVAAPPCPTAASYLGRPPRTLAEFARECVTDLRQVATLVQA